MAKTRDDVIELAERAMGKFKDAKLIPVSQAHWLGAKFPAEDVAGSMKTSQTATVVLSLQYWLVNQVLKFKPASVLDVGCGGNLWMQTYLAAAWWLPRVDHTVESCVA